MKKYLLAAALACAATSALAADVGVSVSIGDPNFYGQINIGNMPPPVLINPQPVVIVQQPHYDAPIYLRVPPGHEKHWDKHCAKYNACNRQVYFVQDNWYKNSYAPQYRKEHHGDDDHQDQGNHHGNGHDKHHKHDD